MSTDVITPKMTDSGLSLSERATLGSFKVADAIAAGSQRAQSGPVAVRWVWVVLIGILVIAAAAAWLWCQRKGYRGFAGHIEAIKGPFGIKIGVKIGCY